MEEILLKCKCGEMKMYQKYIKGVPNKKHWFIGCNNCKIWVEAKTKEKTIKLWNDIPCRKEKKMTREEAIDYLEKLPIDTIIGNANVSMSSNLINMSMEALEKQIPKVPLDFGNESYLCPCCKRNNFYKGAYLDKQKYCDYCGQAIKWE